MKRFLIGVLCTGVLALTASSVFAADKYFCKWTNERGTNKVNFIPGMGAEDFCAPVKYQGEAAYKNCVEKDFVELMSVYNSGKCKKYHKNVHYDTNNRAQCVVEVTNDLADGYIINCYGATASTFRPQIEALYKK